MNSRILKKLCKRAIKFEPAFENLELVDSGCNDPVINRNFDRKHLQRWRGDINTHGYVDLMKGTISLGCYDGGYEPEWEESPAYDILRMHYVHLHTTYSEFGCEYNGMNKITPSKLFKYFNI